ncbi:MAG: hypothetical protein AB1724_01475 [Thermodesulfobacteriota bacterium]
MSDIHANLERYLDAEAILNTFFVSFDFCRQCIAAEMEANGHQPTAACCKNKYYALYDLDHPAFDLLRAERQKRYGSPEDHCRENPVSPCEYHDPARGCLLTTYKSPICLSFLCREAIDALRTIHGIYAYDYLGVHYALELILTGGFTADQYRQFRDSLLEMVRKVEGNY